MKNDLFNFRRFGKYFITDIRTCWANYGLSLLTISVLFPLTAYIVSTSFNLILQSTWNGLDIGLRAAVFATAMICLVVTMPVKCYGKITEKNYGSFWLTLPASRLEKFISMILLTCLIVPVAGALLHIGTDALICAFDHTCGDNLVTGAVKLMQKMSEVQEIPLNFVVGNISIEDVTAAQEIIRQIKNPWMYLDEIFCFTLPLLMGAVFFKSGKTVKTFLAIFAFSMATSAFFAPLMTNWIMNMAETANNDPTAILEIVNTRLFRNLFLIDTVSDTLTNLALLTGIWLRIKTLKH